jgi:hypothetical protein
MQKARPGNPVDVEDQKAAALTKAALDCMRRLGLSPTESAAVIGVQPGALAAMRKGERAVDGLNGEAECADALVRLVKRLQSALGDEETKWRSWLRRENAVLDAKPVDVLVQRHGAVKMVQVLDRPGVL